MSILRTIPALLLFTSVSLASAASHASVVEVTEGDSGMVGDSFTVSATPAPGIYFGRSSIETMVPAFSQIAFTYTFAATPFGALQATSNNFEPADAYYNVTCFGPDGSCSAGTTSGFGATDHFVNNTSAPELITSKFVGSLGTGLLDDENQAFQAEFTTALRGLGRDPSSVPTPSLDFETFAISPVPLPDTLSFAALAGLALIGIGYGGQKRSGER